MSILSQTPIIQLGAISNHNVSFQSKGHLVVNAIVVINCSNQSGYNFAYILDKINLDNGNNSYLKNNERLKDIEKKLKYNDTDYNLVNTLETATDKQSEYDGNDVEIQDMVHSGFDTITGNEMNASSLSLLLLNSEQKRPSTVNNDNRNLQDVVQNLKDNNCTVDPCNNKTIEEMKFFSQSEFSNKQSSKIQKQELPQEFYQEWQNEFVDSDSEVNDWYDNESNEVPRPHLVYVFRPLDLFNDLAVNDIAAQKTSSGIVLPPDVELINVSHRLRASKDISKNRIQEFDISK